MLENLRRLVWKVESLSGITNLRSKATKEKKPLPTIPEENDDVSSHHSRESKFDDFGDAVGETPQIYNDLTTATYQIQLLLVTLVKWRKLFITYFLSDTTHPSASG